MCVNVVSGAQQCRTCLSEVGYRSHRLELCTAAEDQGKTCYSFHQTTFVDEKGEKGEFIEMCKACEMVYGGKSSQVSPLNSLSKDLMSALKVAVINKNKKSKIQSRAKKNKNKRNRRRTKKAVNNGVGKTPLHDIKPNKTKPNPPAKKKGPTFSVAAYVTTGKHSSLVGMSKRLKELRLDSGVEVEIVKVGKDLAILDLENVIDREGGRWDLGG